MLLSLWSDIWEPATFHSRPSVVFPSSPNGKSETPERRKPSPYEFEPLQRHPVLITPPCEVIWLGIKDLSACSTLFSPVAQVELLICILGFCHRISEFQRTCEILIEGLHSAVSRSPCCFHDITARRPASFKGKGRPTSDGHSNLAHNGKETERNFLTRPWQWQRLPHRPFSHCAEESFSFGERGN